jgi:hypothetical protein
MTSNATQTKTRSDSHTSSDAESSFHLIFDPRLTNRNAGANETQDRATTPRLKPTVAQRTELGVAGGDVQIADVFDQREIEVAARGTQMRRGPRRPCRAAADRQ